MAQDAPDAIWHFIFQCPNPGRGSSPIPGAIILVSQLWGALKNLMHIKVVIIKKNICFILFLWKMLIGQTTYANKHDVNASSENVIVWIKWPDNSTLLV